MTISLETASKGEIVKAIEEINRYSPDIKSHIERTVFELRIRAATDRIKATTVQLKQLGPYSTKKPELEAKLAKQNEELKALEVLLIPL